MAVRGGGGHKCAVKWSEKMNLGQGKVSEKSVKSQGISFQTKSGHPV